MIPQFERASRAHPPPRLILCGLIIFAIGLFKKTCLADNVPPLVAPRSARRAGLRPGLVRGAGLYLPALFRFLRLFRHGDRISRMFGIALPLNFDSPYKADQHHRFLAPLAHDAVAVPAGLPVHCAGRKPPRPDPALYQSDGHHVLGGVWHGAGWTFVVWGMLHGAYLCINHAWSKFGPACPPLRRRKPPASF